MKLSEKEIAAMPDAGRRTDETPQMSGKPFWVSHDQTKTWIRGPECDIICARRAHAIDLCNALNAAYALGLKSELVKGEQKWKSG